MFSIQRILVHINLYKVYEVGKNDQTIAEIALLDAIAPNFGELWGKTNIHSLPDIMVIFHSQMNFCIWKFPKIEL